MYVYIYIYIFATYGQFVLILYKRWLNTVWIFGNI